MKNQNTCRYYSGYCILRAASTEGRYTKCCYDTKLKKECSDYRPKRPLGEILYETEKLEREIREL